MNLINASSLNLTHAETVAALIDGLRLKHKKLIPKDVDISGVKIAFTTTEPDGDQFRFFTVTLPATTEVINPTNAVGE